MQRTYFEAIAILVGTIIGAGVLGIPYVVARAGFVTGLVSLVFIGFMILMLNLYLGEITSRTKGRHQLVGYADRYLGHWGKKLMTLSVLVGTYGALIAYLIGVGSSVNAMLGIREVFATVGFFILASALVYLGLRTIGKWELGLGALVLLIILFIFFVSFSKFNVSNLTGFSLRNLFIPYGVIFFAFIGTAAIPEVRSILDHDRKRLKRAIIIGSVIPIVAYILFTIGVIAVTGLGTTEIATIGLGRAIGGYMVIVGNLFAIIAMSTSFLALGLAITWIYRYDYKIRKFWAWFLAVFPPLAIALSGLTGFVQVIGISGAVAGGIDGLLIVMMHRRAKKFGEVKPAYQIKERWYVSVLLALIFIGGIVYTVVNLVA